MKPFELVHTRLEVKLSAGEAARCCGDVYSSSSRGRLASLLKHMKRATMRYVVLVVPRLVVDLLERK